MMVNFELNPPPPTTYTQLPIGLLEKPDEQEVKVLPVLHEKMFLVGKSGVGKTSTIDKLAGRGGCVFKIEKSAWLCIKLC